MRDWEKGGGGGEGEVSRNGCSSRSASFSDFPWDASIASPRREDTLSTNLEEESQDRVEVDRWKRIGGYSRSVRVLAKHDLFYRSSRGQHNSGPFRRQLFTFCASAGPDGGSTGTQEFQRRQPPQDRNGVGHIARVSGSCKNTLPADRIYVGPGDSESLFVKCF